MMNLASTAKAALATLVFSACASATADPPSGPATPHASGSAERSATADPAASVAQETNVAPEKEPEPGSLRARLMRDHFKETVTIRNAVISGELHKAVNPARVLADMEGVNTLPTGWVAAVTRLNQASGRIRQGADLPEVAAATADIGRACGSCHVRSGGPKPKLGDPPAAGTSMKERMTRHQWATERMWEGLYVPSAAAWEAAVAVLENDPFPKGDLAGGGVHARSAAARFTELVQRAKTANSGEAQASVYASVLTTCSPCHDAMGK